MIDLSRRYLLKLAGVSAIGGLGLNWSKAFAADQVLDVVIVGAGLSGLTAARDLQLAGIQSFAVLEARHRVGGRTLNHELGNGFISEAGGQWIGPGQTEIADLAADLGIGTFPTYYDGKTVILGGKGRLAIDLDGTFGTDRKIADKLSALAREVPPGAPWAAPHAAELDKLSLGDWLIQQGVKPEDRAGWDMIGSLSGGISPAKMSLLQFLATINNGGGFSSSEEIRHSAQETRFVGGSQLLSIRMARQLGARLRLSCPVRRISDWNGDVVSLQTDGGEVRARRVIMAIHPALCNQIQFSPPLPDRRVAVQREWPATAPWRKTAMVYSRPFWRDKGLNGNIVQLSGPVQWAYDNSPPRGEIGVINAFVSPGQLPSDPKAAERIQAEIYAQALGAEALEPLSYHDQDWCAADQWSVACIPAIPPGFWSRHGDAARTPCGKLIWSGSETADLWVGYMEGAVRAGHASARQVLCAPGGAAGACA